MDDIEHYMVRVSKLSKENKRLRTLNRDLLVALVAAREEIADSLYEAEESFNDARTIDYLKRLLERADKAIAKADGKEVIE